LWAAGSAKYGTSPPALAPTARPSNLEDPIALPSSTSAAALPPKKRGNTVGARSLALSLWDDGLDHAKVTAKTGFTRSGLYKLREKAVSRGWRTGEIVEIWHVDDAPRPGRAKISTALVEHIIQIVTKNSTTRQWSCARIAAEVTATPGWQPISASTVYRVLTADSYGVFKRTVKPGLKEADKQRRLDWCLEHRWTLRTLEKRDLFR
jgi:hypothetical protein